MTGRAELTQIHAEERNDLGVASTVLVYLHDQTGELVIGERIPDDGPADVLRLAYATNGVYRTVISAAGAQAIADALRPPPATETHGNPDLDATIEARLAQIRHGVG